MGGWVALDVEKGQERWRSEVERDFGGAQGRRKARKARLYLGSLGESEGVLAHQL